MAGKNGDDPVRPIVPDKKGKDAQVPSRRLVQMRHVVAVLVGVAVAAVIGAAIATAALLPASQQADQRAAALEEQLAAE